MINTDTGHDWPEPEWFDQPALGRTTINTPHDLQLFREVNDGKPYQEQIRPGGFLTLAHPHPIEQRGLLLIPFTPEPEEAMTRANWVDRASGEAGLRIRTDRPEYVIEGSVAVLDYRHYAEQYMSHREWKGQESLGGLIVPRSLAPPCVARIGKESDPLTYSVPFDGSTTLNNPRSPNRCVNCGTTLGGRQRRWCSEQCRKRFARRTCHRQDVA